MATQPDSRPSASERERNAELLTEVLRLHEHRLRRQAFRHAQLPDDADDALQTAYSFLERYRGWVNHSPGSTPPSSEKHGPCDAQPRQRECSLTSTGERMPEIDLVEILPTEPRAGGTNERQETLAERRGTLPN